MERLPRDVTIDIISRLPIKSVLRCKSVSKSWEALLSDPSFAAIHFNNASTLFPFSDYITREGNVFFFIEIEDEDIGTSTINFPFPKVFNLRPSLMGSCLGYVCVSTRDEYWGGPVYPKNPMYVFNPITGANILLPRFKENGKSACLYGFGLDVSTQECKVLLVYPYEETFSVQVHTVGRDCSWRSNTVPTMLTDVTGAELMKGDFQTSLPLDFNGSIHWIVLSSVDEDDIFDHERVCILSFQLDTEQFGVIPMPEPLQVMKPYFYNSMMYALQVSGGCLSIIYSPQASFVDMWVMADYNISQSWVKKYSIQLNCMRGCELMPLGFRKNGELMLCFEIKRPLGFRNNGELMLCFEQKGLVSCNTDGDRCQILKSCRTIPFPFVGSLISLKSAYGLRRQARNLQVISD